MNYLLKYVNEGLSNVGLSLEPTIALLIFFVTIIMTTKDMRVGLLIGMLLYAIGLIITYSLGLNTFYFALGVLVTFALLTLSLLIKKSTMGVY